MEFILKKIFTILFLDIKFFWGDQSMSKWVFVGDGGLRCLEIVREPPAFDASVDKWWWNRMLNIGHAVIKIKEMAPNTNKNHHCRDKMPRKLFLLKNPHVCFKKNYSNSSEIRIQNMEWLKRPPCYEMPQWFKKIIIHKSKLEKIKNQKINK